jgi:hypothetical protein
MLILIDAFPIIIEIGNILKKNNENLSKIFNLILNN